MSWRHRVWVASLAAGGIACGAFALLSPGPMALPLAFVIFPIVTFTVVGAVIAYAMSADIVDYGRLATGEDHSGFYGSIVVFLQKSDGSFRRESWSFPTGGRTKKRATNRLPTSSQS